MLDKRLGAAQVVLERVLPAALQKTDLAIADVNRAAHQR